MKANSIKGKSPADINEALHQIMTDGFTPTLAIVFLSIKQDKHAVCEILDKAGISIFGSTSAGEFIDGEVGEGSTAILLLEIDRDSFTILFEDTGARSTRDVARLIGQRGLAVFSKPAFIVCGSGVTADGEMITRGIEDVVGNTVTIFGGMAGDDFTMTGTYVFTNGKFSDNGIVAIILDEDKFILKGLATCGWQPVGTVKTITKSEGCWVYTIDDKPALDMIVKYMGIPSLNKEVESEIVLNIGSNFPMQVERENGSFVMRTAMLANWKENSFMCAGNIPQGSKIRFTLPPDFDVIDTVISACEEVKENQLPQADAMILFSCKARHIALGPLVGKEIQGLKDVWDTPMVGYFTYGEFGKATKGKQEFHNITCCWVALKEK
jgi:hypothetical protein